MTPLRQALGSDRGITLAEILVATVIISVGLVGLALVIPLSSYGVHEGNAMSTATFLAEQRLEEVRNTTWTTLPTATDCLGVSASTTAAPTSTTCARDLTPNQTSVPDCTSGTSCTTFIDEGQVSGYTAYARTVRVTDCGTTSCAGVATGGNANKMRLVRVTVTYRPITGVGGSATTAAKSAVLEMIVAKRE